MSDSAIPPPLEAERLAHGVVTMRCDLTTCSSAHISLLVSGSAQTCFDDQLLERHIKNEIIEKGQLIHAQLSSDESNPSPHEPLSFVSIAGGAPVSEVHMKVPTWALQVLKQLAPAFSYRSLVTLGVASIQGRSVASFEKDDATRLLFFYESQGKVFDVRDSVTRCPPSWSCSPIKKRSRTGLGLEASTSYQNDINEYYEKEKRSSEGSVGPSFVGRKRLKVAALKPVPCSRESRMLVLPGRSEPDMYGGSSLKPDLPIAASIKQKLFPLAPAAPRKLTPRSSHIQQLPLNPLPLKKHGCNRTPLLVCSEEEFLRDVMQFLILRGHSRLVPRGGISEFPDVVLNATRLDLYNLYREVVSRGGFYVGNGINWKGQVFSKMRNHTATNRMTGVGNTLKRHYETYLLEYELAHDDVDGECCLLCHSSAPGDWVNCGLCSEWAHFGCDRRHGLGSFKDYAKTDGIEYICPHCTLTNDKRKLQNRANGFRNMPTVSGHV